MADPREVYPEPIRQGVHAPIGIKNPVPKDVVLQSAYEYVSRDIIDEFRHQSWFFDHMPRIEITNAVYGGGTTTYKYYRAAGTASATSRPINSEVDETYTDKTSEITNIANLASSVSMDVALMRLGGIEDEWNFQLKGALQGVSDLFNEMVIRGDSAVPARKDDPAVGPAAFDGLDKIIRKESLHVWNRALDLTGLDLTEPVVIDGVQNTRSHPHYGVINKMMAWMRKLRPAPTFILGNDELIAALSALGSMTGIYQAQKNDFGDTIDTIKGISLIPMGKRCGYNEEIIPIRKTNTKCRENPNGKPNQTYETVAYVGSFGDLAIQGLQLPGDLVEIRLPDMNVSGHMKKVDIDMQIGMVVKSRHSVGMFEHVCLPADLIEFPEFVDNAP